MSLTFLSSSHRCRAVYSILGACLILAMLVGAGRIVFAEIGSGAGASGHSDSTCKNDATFWAHCGWGWVVYPLTANSGPNYTGSRHWQFKNPAGSPWSISFWNNTANPNQNISGRCSADYTSVMVFVYGNYNGDVVGYNYQGNQSTSTAFDPGDDIKGGGKAVSSADAATAYNNLPSSMKTGYTWGSNVAWFCYGLKPSHWQLSGTTTDSVSSVYPGDSVTFTSKIKNDNEGGTATFVYGPRYFYSNTNSPAGGMGDPYSGELAGGIANQNGSLGPNDTKTGIVQTINIPVTTTAKFICGTVAFSDYDDDGHSNGRSTADCITINHPVASCGALSTTPSAVEPGLPFSLSAQITYGSSADLAAVRDNGSPTFYLEVVNSTGTVIYNAASLTPTPAGGSGKVYTLSASSITIPATSAAGIYTIQYGISSNLGSKDCTPSLMVAYHPYFSVLGGDITAGQGYGAACTDATADIQAWNTNGGLFGGAGSQVRATATGTINNFVSGLGLSGGVGNGHQLSFANTGSGVNITNPNYGGKFGTIPCATNYYAGATGTNSLPSFGSTSGTYSVTGNQTLGANTLSPNTKITLYVKGNVYLTGNITYAHYNLDKVPRFNLYVQGNIYISPNVSELHGVYVAQKASPTSTTSGSISTCVSSGSETTAPYATCNKPLLVVGAVFAERQLQLMRTCSSLVANAPCSNGVSPLVASRPAETFQYGPELWLSTNGTDLQLKSYTSLPPVL